MRVWEAELGRLYRIGGFTNLCGWLYCCSCLQKLPSSIYRCTRHLMDRFCSLIHKSNISTVCNWDGRWWHDPWRDIEPSPTRMPHMQLAWASDMRFPKEEEMVLFQFIWVHTRSSGGNMLPEISGSNSATM